METFIVLLLILIALVIIVAKMIDQDPMPRRPPGDEELIERYASEMHPDWTKQVQYDYALLCWDIEQGVNIGKERMSYYKYLCAQKRNTLYKSASRLSINEQIEEGENLALQ